MVNHEPITIYHAPVTIYHAPVTVNHAPIISFNYTSVNIGDSAIGTVFLGTLLAYLIYGRHTKYVTLGSGQPFNNIRFNVSMAIYCVIE